MSEKELKCLIKKQQTQKNNQIWWGAEKLKKIATYISLIDLFSHSVSA